MNFLSLKHVFQQNFKKYMTHLTFYKFCIIVHYFNETFCNHYESFNKFSFNLPIKYFVFRINDYFT